MTSRAGLLSLLLPPALGGRDCRKNTWRRRIDWLALSRLRQLVPTDPSGHVLPWSLLSINFLRFFCKSLSLTLLFFGFHWFHIIFGPFSVGPRRSSENVFRSLPSLWNCRHPCWTRAWTMGHESSTVIFHYKNRGKCFILDRVRADLQEII